MQYLLSSSVWEGRCAALDGGVRLKRHSDKQAVVHR
jgi:hypothetical protein